MIEELIKNEKWMLQDVADSVFLSRWKEMFNAQNFFLCVYYMKDYLDFNGSPARGKWYMQNIFTNLGLFTFRWIKAGKKTGESRQHLLDAYDILALNERYDEIMIDDFQQLTQKYRNAREKRKRDFTQVNTEIVDVDVGEMPSKVVASVPANRRARPLDYFDEEGFDDDEEEEQHEEEDTD